MAPAVLTLTGVGLPPWRAGPREAQVAAGTCAVARESVVAPASLFSAWGPAPGCWGTPRD